jgi:glycosyltransferase involved in cell wall biosynthesis
MDNLSVRLAKRGVSSRTIDSGKSRLLRNYLVFPAWLGLRCIVALENRPQWIIARSTDGIVVAFLSRLFRFKTKTALHSHGWEEKAYQAEHQAGIVDIFPKTTWKARIIRFPLLKTTLALCDLCICGTLEEARWIKNRYTGFAGRVVCVPNGVAVAVPSHRFSGSDATPRFLAVGNATWKKNVGYAVRVFRSVQKRVPGAQLFVIGSSFRDLSALTNESIPNGVTAIASELPEMMPKWFEKCPYFVTMSRYEGGRSLAMLEAMAQGCVVFTSAIPSAAECIKNAVNGFVVSGIDPDQDAQTIVGVLRDQDLCAQVSMRALRFAKRQSWERQTRRLERALWPPR